MTNILAKELRGRNISVSAVAPGPTATDLFLKGKTDGFAGIPGRRHSNHYRALHLRENNFRDGMCCQVMLSTVNAVVIHDPVR